MKITADPTKKPVKVKVRRSKVDQKIELEKNFTQLSRSNL